MWYCLIQSSKNYQILTRRLHKHKLVLLKHVLTNQMKSQYGHLHFVHPVFYNRMKTSRTIIIDNTYGGGGGHILIGYE